MTNQTMFNRVTKHLLRQGRRSIGVGAQCLYRGPGGLMCGIGLLIPDAKYRPEFEGSDPEAGEFCLEICDAAGIRQNQVEFAIALQSVHDQCEPTTWMKDLKSIAKQYRLTFPKIARKDIAKACGGLA